MRVKCLKCGREFNRQNNLDLHLTACKGIKKEIRKKKITEELPIIKEVKEITDNKITECKDSKTGSHDLIVLRPINYIQRNAIKCGYTAYCRICRELI